MGINTLSGRISDCNMYHRGIYLQCEGRGGCFISRDSNGKHDVLQPRVVKAGRGTGKKTFTINRRVKGSFRADICRMHHHHQPWEKAERQNGWVESSGQPCSVLLLPFSLWLCSVICSRAAGWTKVRELVVLRCPCSLTGFFLAFGLWNASHQKHLQPSDSSSALWFLNRSCRWTRSWMTSWARSRLSWGISRRHRCQGQPPHLSDLCRQPQSPPQWTRKCESQWTVTCDPLVLSPPGISQSRCLQLCHGWNEIFCSSRLMRKNKNRGKKKKREETARSQSRP